ncbi:glycosyltransferase family 1 protein [soil metagenome]
MIIGIDGNEANTDRRVGIGEFAFELINQFGENNDNGLTFQIYLKNKPKDDLPEQNKEWKYQVFGPKKAWTQFALPVNLFLKKPRPSVFFTPSHYAPRFSPVPTVISLMDLSYIHFPELFTKKDLYQLKNWTAYSVKKAQRIFTISNASKNDIIKVYHIAEDKIDVLYPGIKTTMHLEPHIYPMNELQSKYGIGKEYILFVGTLQPRKNIKRLIEAFSQIVKQKEHVNLQLVIVGKKGWQYEEIIAAPALYEVSSSVKFLDFVEDADLALLYSHAICYVLPSLYEGFGLPVLEAMKHDCPVITSNVSSLPEAGGDAALYVNPTDTKDIAKKIAMLVTDKDLRKELIQKGRKQVEKFSWEKTAQKALSILEEVGKVSS